MLTVSLGCALKSAQRKRWVILHAAVLQDTWRRTLPELSHVLHKVFICLSLWINVQILCAFSSYFFFCPLGFPPYLLIASQTELHLLDLSTPMVSQGVLQNVHTHTNKFDSVDVLYNDENSIVFWTSHQSKRILKTVIPSTVPGSHPRRVKRQDVDVVVINFSFEFHLVFEMNYEYLCWTMHLMTSGSQPSGATRYFCWLVGATYILDWCWR